MREEGCIRIDEMREEERVHMEQNIIIISSESTPLDESLETLSDDSYDSGRRQIPTKPVISYYKSLVFLAKNNSDNEKTPLKKPHKDTFTLKQVTL